MVNTPDPAHDNTDATPGSADAPDEFAVAVAAVTRAIKAMNADQRPGDGGEFITHLLATVAANLGSSSAVTMSRPGSWEADGVKNLLASTVGWDDEFLMTFRTDPVELVVDVLYEVDDFEMWETFEASIQHIGQAMFGDRWSIGRGNLTIAELERIDAVDELLSDLEERDREDYKARFTDTVHAEFERRRAADPGKFPEHLTVAVRFADHSTSSSELTDGWSGGLASELYVHARTNTPLPGSDTVPDFTTAGGNAASLLAAGHWPHLRIPELAHHGTPPTQKEN